VRPFGAGLDPGLDLGPAGSAATLSPHGADGLTDCVRQPLACCAVTLETGMRGSASLLVGEEDTARAMRSGDAEVLGSPRLIALCEQATVDAIATALDEGSTSVGMRVQFDHLQPTPVGAEVHAEAVLERIDGRRLKFTVSARDSGGIVAAGKITRVVVDRDRFMSKCCS
jgi:predicted thioesterase